MPGAELDIAVQRAEQWRSALEATPAESHGGPVLCTVSIGVTLYRAADPAGDSLLDRADRALYVAKRSGRNRVCSDDNMDQ